MKDLLSQVTNELVRTQVDDCMVEGCEADNAEVIELLALDPIDHDNQHLALCDDHIGWAKERNELARDVYDELRQARAEIGHSHRERIQELSQPEFSVDTSSLSMDTGDVRKEVESL